MYTHILIYLYSICKYVYLSLLPFATAVKTDEEDLFMVCDLLTGGDLRYHLQNRVSANIYNACT